MSTTSIRLISALRKAKSQSALVTTPIDYFDESEVPAYEFIRNFVEQYNRWPSASTVERETGVRLVLAKEPTGYYLDQARQRALYRSLAEPFAGITEAIRDQRPDDVIALMKDCVSVNGALTTSQSSNIITYQDSIPMVVNDYDAAKRSIGLRGVPTGYPMLDEKWDGMQTANMYTFVGRPGRGKSQKLVSIAKAARDAGRSVLFLSMEMGVLQLARRMFALDTLLDTKFLRSGKLSTIVEREMRRQAEILADSDMPPIYFLAGNFKKSVDALDAAAQVVEPDLIIGDAAYLMKASGRTKATAKHEVLSDVMEDFADMLIRLDRPGAISVQFNRTGQKARRGSNDGGDEDSPEQVQVRNPLAHLDLAKIAGSDAIGQISASVVGIDLVEPPHDHDERYAGILKSREGEDFGWYRYHYKFRPPNFSQIEDYRQHETRGQRHEGPDLSYMDVEA